MNGCLCMNYLSAEKECVDLSPDKLSVEFEKSMFILQDRCLGHPHSAREVLGECLVCIIRRPYVRSPLS